MTLLLVPVRAAAVHASRVTPAVLGWHTLAFARSVIRHQMPPCAPPGWVPAGTATPAEVAAEAILSRAGLWRPTDVPGLGVGFHLDGWDIAVAAMRLVGRG